MKQSTVIFGVLIFTFIVFVTLRGDLPTWLSLFTAKGRTSSGGKSKDESGSTLGKAADLAEDYGGLIPGVGPFVSAGASIGKMIGKFV